MIALSLDDVAISFGGVRAVAGVSMTVAAGERRVLLGPNGAGKSTVFNIVGGQLRPNRGRVTLFDRDVTRLSPHRRAHCGLNRTFQITSLFPALSVAENVYLAVQAGLPDRFSLLRNSGRNRATQAQVDRVLAQWRLTDSRTEIVRDLSYGEQRKLEIAMAMAHAPRLLLLDEPTAGLSTIETANVVSLIKELGRDVTIMVIEHDMDVAFEIGERFTILNQGQVVAEGDAEAIRSNPEIKAIYFGDAQE